MTNDQVQSYDKQGTKQCTLLYTTKVVTILRLKTV